MGYFLLWILTWSVIWLVFNVYFKWRFYKLKTLGYIEFAIFFSINFAIIFLLFNKFLVGSIYQLLLGLIITNVIGIVFGSVVPLYKKIKRGRYFLVFHSFDILMQQSMIVAGVLILKNSLGQNYSDFFFGGLFLLAHFPIIFLKWLKPEVRYLYLILTFLGGALFSHLIVNTTLGVTISFLAHFLIYVVLIEFIKDERKI